MWLPVKQGNTYITKQAEMQVFYLLEIIMYKVNANDNIEVKAKAENSK